MERYENLLLLAKDEFDGENYKEAERLINEALTIERNNVDAWVMKSRLAYYNDRGLAASYKYLKTAFDLCEDKKNIKPLLDAFYEVSYKELKWQLDRSLDRLEYREKNTGYEGVFTAFIKDGTQLCREFGTFDPQNNAARDFLNYAAKAIEKAWREVAKDYYQYDVVDYGVRWERETLYKNDYRPSDSEMMRFVYSCATLGEIISFTSMLEYEKNDFDLMLKLINLGHFILNQCVKAKAYCVSSEWQTIIVFYEDEDNKDDFVMEFEEDYSYGFEIHWRRCAHIGKNIRAFCDEIQNNLYRHEASIKKYRKEIEEKK